uniref:Uncharacterized protein n=1 Tax=Arundo donax TaxID=35708 RepID=A0A0A9BU09_ARUDO
MFQISKGNINILNEPWCPIRQNMHELLTIPPQRTYIPNIVSNLWTPNTDPAHAQNRTIFLINLLLK